MIVLLVVLLPVGFDAFTGCLFGFVGWRTFLVFMGCGLVRCYFVGFVCGVC